MLGPGQRCNDSNEMSYPYSRNFGNWFLPLFSECILGPGERLYNSNEISYPVFRILVVLTIGSFACYLNAFWNAPLDGSSRKVGEEDGMNESNDEMT